MTSAVKSSICNGARRPRASESRQPAALRFVRMFGFGFDTPANSADNSHEVYASRCDISRGSPPS